MGDFKPMVELHLPPNDLQSDQKQMMEDEDREEGENHAENHIGLCK